MLVKGLAALFASTLVAGLAMGQEVEAKKEAPIQKLFPTAFSSLKLRHDTDILMSQDKYVSSKPTVEGYYTLGSTFFDGKLSADVLLVGVKRTETPTYQEKYRIIEMEYSLVELDNFTFKPAANVYLPLANGASGTVGTGCECGFVAEAKVKPSSEWTLTATFNPYTQAAGFGSRDQKVKVKNDTGRPGSELGLTGDSADEINQKSPSYETDYIARAAYAPAVLKGLTVSAQQGYFKTFEPKYKVDAETGRVEQDGYASGYDRARTGLGVKYALTDKVSVSNNTYHYTGGLFQYGLHQNVDAKREYINERWENRLDLDITLF